MRSRRVPGRLRAETRSSPGSGARVGRPVHARPTEEVFRYRLIRSPALAEIVGDCRPWTVLMISLLSMPWR
jgi:hypothetical protein